MEWSQTKKIMFERELYSCLILQVLGWDCLAFSPFWLQFGTLSLSDWTYKTGWINLHEYLWHNIQSVLGIPVKQRQWEEE